MNPWQRLKSLIEPAPKLVGVISAHNADGTASITLTGGGSIRVPDQSYAVGKRVFVRNHEIIGDAPDLPSYTIDV